ncbi:V-type proton ATPase subunit G [Golovinomyces cichoracearum]|uniref:V-type proton ATPase subunit G n=1 Tax=Golovinomyces cichoracearum TaxID=62708 RepID=A0A420HJ23_9PEZI|nr:V-type proton ATPase subunit G [Golovinomyces cichoracearum]
MAFPNINRTKRVKDARDEAKKEIDAYKKEKDEELKKYESEHVSGNLKAEEDANLEAEKKIFEIQEAGKEKRDVVVQKLLDAVFEITPVVSTRIETSQ